MRILPDVPAIADIHPGSGRAERGALLRPAFAGAVAGLAAALLAAGVALWAGERYGGVVTAQLLADRLTDITPVSLFGRMLERLEENAKPLTLLGLTLAQGLAGAAIGAVYAVITRRARLPLAVGALALSAMAWLTLSLVVAPLGQVGLLARNAPNGATATQLLFLASAAVFGIVTALGVTMLSGGPTVADVDPTRRRLVSGLAAAALLASALAGAGYTGRYALRLRSKSGTTPAAIVVEDGAQSGASSDPFAFAGMPRFVTPTEEFYVVSKNILDPKVNGSAWVLEVDGLVRDPLRLSLSDVLARESVEFVSTLECISNPVGGKYISTAVWRGFPLAELLAEAGLLDGVVDLELHAADGYVESIPLAAGLAAETMLVHGMNGEPLDDRHGFPARLIVPGIYGMKNVKWLTKITVVNEDIQGFWQQRGWSDAAPVRTMSRIDVPWSGARVAAGELLTAGGVAFAGDRGIARVEASFDAGVTWSEAELSDVPSDLTWRLWRIDHTPASEGTIELRVRATDGEGEVQTDAWSLTLPDGSTGHHSLRVTVEAQGASRQPMPSMPTPRLPGGGVGDGG